MISLYKYINNSLSPFKLSPEDKKKLICLDGLFWEIAQMYHNDKPRYTTNIEGEIDKFLSAYESGVKYFPKLEFETENKYLTDGVIEKIDHLLFEFRNFNCFLSKYYIEILLAYKQMIRGCMDPKNTYPMFNAIRLQKPSLEMYDLAMQTIKDHPYQKVDKDKRNLDAKDAYKELEDYLNELDWEWDVQLKDNMQPRMAVGADKLSINKTSTFSKVDIEGLKAHEVKGHVGRRYYAHKTGLYLFVEGLLWRNTLDEGLAIWNSLHLVDEQKPNIMFNIALKTIIAYHLNEKDFYELFDFIHKLVPTLPKNVLFKTIIRFKRELTDCSIIGGNGDDMSYFVGYQIVKNMTDQERDDILKYNIGPDQIKDLPKIKEFFKINKFEPLIKGL
jgi:hypothetical protein